MALLCKGGDEAAVCQQLRLLCVSSTNQATTACEYLTNKAVNSGPARKVPDPYPLPDEVVKTLDKCKNEKDCKTLADFEKKGSEAAALLKIWCLERRLQGIVGSSKVTVAKLEPYVCEAVLGARPGEVSVAALQELRKALEIPEYNCNGFGLVTPFFSFRRPGNGTVDVKAFAGLGAGYYKACGCKKDWNWGLDVFGYTEGLELGEQRFHVGVGTTVGIGVAGMFKFGLGVGYDIYRQEKDDAGVIQRNGLLAARQLGAQSISYLVTFSVTPGAALTSDADKTGETE